MNSDQWDHLSTWHNAWLDAAPEDRQRLRDEFVAAEPDLQGDADALVSAGAPGRDFLETPAFLLSARQLALDSPELAAGAQVGPYRIVQLIARGGMGLVYRATDVRLGRDVALKMLAPIGAPDPHRVDRFVQEARATASIDHPNVVKVHDVGLFDGQPYIVVELLDGETLRARIERGMLPLAEARHVATDIARGLVAAAAAGLVHRDLKPENIFLTRAGIPKILDFGIAKLAPDATGRGASSTLTGILLGTAGYLAPEQIRGESVDGRADLFALGSILFELVTGQRAFAGEHTVDTLHAILHAPAPDVLALRPETPPVLSTIVARLLEKAPADRFQSAADLVWTLEQFEIAPVARAAPEPVATRARTTALRSRLWWIVAPVGLAAVALITWQLAGAWAPPSQSQALTRFAWTLPSGTALSSAPIVSPDGRRITWVGMDATGTSKLFVRALASVDATPLAGTEGARHPFWSPDSQSIGFFAPGKLARIAVDGGVPVVVANTGAPGNARGGTWGAGGVIVFQPTYRDGSLLRVSSKGGKVEPVTALDPANEEIAHRWPSFLPDGVHFVYSIVSMRDDRRGIYVGSSQESAAQPHHFLFGSDSNAVYSVGRNAPAGVLLAISNGRIETRGFDAERRALAGDVRSMEIAAVGTSPHHSMLLTASAEVLAYASAPIPWGHHRASIATDGTDLRIPPERELGGFPRLSPDGQRLARAKVDVVRNNPDIWVDDLVRGTSLRLTTSGDFDVMPVWSPDGKQVAYRSGTLSAPTIGFAAADGTGVTRTLPCPVIPCEVNDWSSDGRSLIVTVKGADIWSVPVEPGQPPTPLFAQAFTERDARISPDGHWISYVSDESGRAEVSVQHLSGAPRRYVISSGGGDQPVWRHDGGALFFAGPEGRLFSVSVRADGRDALAFGPAVPLNVPTLGERHWGTTYEVSADGRRVYFPHPGDLKPPHEFNVIIGWSALVK